MNILVLNCGSSSVKFQLISSGLQEIETDRDKMLAKGHIERIGGAALLTFQAGDGEPERFARPIRDIRSALDSAIEWIGAETTKIEGVVSLSDIHAVGHRVVHGGEKFSRSVLVDDDILRGITECIDLAPLHNPANIHGINAARTIFGKALPQAVVFDTAFHQTMPDKAFLYAIPYQFYRRHKIRRYGFHGTSHRYIAYRYRTINNVPRENVNVITLHLGNGCSIAAIKGGNSVDTSMGFTPLEGLVMGTRSGDLDPAIVEFICDKEEDRP